MGSTTCFLRRHQQHLANSYKHDDRVNTRFYKYLVENGGWKNVRWIPIYSQEELVNLFIQENKGIFINSQKLFILRA